MQRIDCFNELKERASRQRREYVALGRAHPERTQMHDLFEILHAFGRPIRAHIGFSVPLSRVAELFDLDQRVLVLL